MTEPSKPAGRLADVLCRFGDRWQIGRHETLDAWTAVIRPTPTTIWLIVGRDLDELAMKLTEADT